jgi:hypothetical protein
MTKPPNTNRAEVALPEYPGGRFIRFTVDAMERLEALYPEDWIATVLDGLGKAKASVIIACLESAKVGDEEFNPRYYADTPGLADAVIVAIKDALYLTLAGKTTAELAEDQEKKRMEALERAVKEMGVEMEEPKLRAILSLRDSGLLGTVPDSDPTTSDISPQ